MWSFFKKIGSWIKGLFTKSNVQAAQAAVETASAATAAVAGVLGNQKVSDVAAAVGKGAAAINIDGNTASQDLLDVAQGVSTLVAGAAAASGATGAAEAAGKAAQVAGILDSTLVAAQAAKAAADAAAAAAAAQPTGASAPVVMNLRKK